MRGKDKCRMLREIRRQIAEQNDIEFVTEECRFKGECRGTCPKCESELKYLEEQLEHRKSIGKRIAVAGIAAGTAIAMSGCAAQDVIDAAVNISKAVKTNVCGINQPDPNIIEIEMGEIEIMGDVPFYYDE